MSGGRGGVLAGVPPLHPSSDRWMESSSIHATAAAATFFLRERIWALFDELLNIRSTVLSRKLGTVPTHGHAILVDEKFFKVPICVDFMM